ncbi:SnoaL-like polyketide cyclase [compost metagenome]
MSHALPEGLTMAMSREEMDRRIDEHFRFEAEDNVAGVLATLALDVEHDIVGNPDGPTHGRESARAFYQSIFSDLSESRVETLRRYYGEDFLVDESMWFGKAPGRPFGVEGRGRPLQFRLLHVVEFAGNGDIHRENVWVDLAAILQQLPQD